MDNNFQFNFSLEILNLLGRGLYRNFATVVAEAVSNSWDAEATEVRISIDQNNKAMTIRDNGKGMNSNDFQNKFLKVGYARREDPNNNSKRKVLGRKGIGKLAMLSISEKVTIISKKAGSTIIGGRIDNKELDNEIKNDGQYALTQLPINDNLIKEHGTSIEFSSIKDSVNNPYIIKKHLAVLFNFSFSFKNEKFYIFVNDEQVTRKDLAQLYENTQFLWMINLPENNLTGLQEQIGINKELTLETDGKKNEILSGYYFKAHETQYFIKGYIASVTKPSQLAIRGTEGEFKAGLHLFVNGRLREEDILKDIASHRVVESYLYGEIHVDGLDNGEDIFTSSREGIIKDDQRYQSLLAELKKIQTKILDDWDSWRRTINQSKIKQDTGINFNKLKPEKQKIIDTFLNNKEDEGLKEKFREQFLKDIIPKPSGKKILISHSNKDKNLADKVYQSLLDYRFQKADIIYTSSKDVASRLPPNTDIFNYFRDFFVQDWRNNHPVIFVVSKSMEESWFASLEAGAVWITTTKHNIAVAHEHQPLPPLDIENLYIQFDENGEYSDPVNAEIIFKSLSNNL